MEMNTNLQNVYVSSWIGLINIHTLSQFNKSSNLTYMNWGFFNGDVSGGHCYSNIQTVSESNNHKSIYSTNKSDKSTHNRSEMENTVLQDGVDIDVMLLASTLHQYVNM